MLHLQETDRFDDALKLRTQVVRVGFAADGFVPLVLSERVHDHSSLLNRRPADFVSIAN